METVIIEEFRKGIAEIKGGITETQSVLKEVEDENQKLKADLDKVRRQWLARGPAPAGRRPGFVSDECARNLGALFILGNARSGRLDLLDARARESLFAEARSILGLETRTALTTTDIPLPTEYFGEIRELISEFGVARRNMFPFPIGLGTAKPPRFKTRPALDRKSVV